MAPNPVELYRARTAQETRPAGRSETLAGWIQKRQGLRPVLPLQEGVIKIERA